jgi:peptide deformylase
MALLNILEFPDPRLRKVAEPIAEVDESIRQLCKDMLETMYEAPGIGLAATQVNVHKRLLVCDISEDQSQPLVFINPEIQESSEEVSSYDEGCLSVPGYFEEVERPDKVIVNALDQEGTAFQIEIEGLLSTCIQHEIDHLNGKLFVDYLSPIKRQRIRSKLEKQHKKRA